ncbi:MAG: hypothetical protein KGM91_23185, partial [Burkholderiales bacterium]|nr:hypothetical protein [Burkholderiales bacterium]
MTSFSVLRRLGNLEARRPSRAMPVYRTTVASLAMCRLLAAADAARRGPLTERRLCALADRLESGIENDDDRAVIGAFSRPDLGAAGTTARELVAAQADLVRGILSALPVDPEQPGAVADAALVIEHATGVLRDRLAELPEPDELSRLGDLLLARDETADDLLV